MAPRLDRERPFGQIHPAHHGALYEQDGNFYSGTGDFMFRGENAPAGSSEAGASMPAAFVSPTLPGGASADDPNRVRVPLLGRAPAPISAAERLAAAKRELAEAADAFDAENAAGAPRQPPLRPSSQPQNPGPGAPVGAPPNPNFDQPKKAATLSFDEIEEADKTDRQRAEPEKAGPPDASKPSDVDLRAWARGEAQYPFFQVKKRVVAEYGDRVTTTNSQTILEGLIRLDVVSAAEVKR